jgi:signal transduction histidine kinase/CheY-like chemotaxis protein
MTNTPDTTASDAVTANPAGATFLQPSPRWGVLAGALAALALPASAWLSPWVDKAWLSLLALVLPPSLLQAPILHWSSLGWGATLWVTVVVALMAVASGPWHGARIAALCGAFSTLLLSLSVMGRAFSSADTQPLLCLAALWGGVGGRYAYDLWLRWSERRQAAHQRAVRVAVQQARADFLQQVARDLRTPIHSVVGVADLLAETALDLDQRRHMTVFKRSADALTRVVDDLGDLAKMENHRVTLKPAPIGLVTLLHEQINALRGEAEAKGLQLQLSLSSDLPRTVHGDVRRLSQVLSQVLGQAVRSTRQGRVSVEVRPHARHSDMVRFTVTDTRLSPVTGRLASLMEPFEGTRVDGKPRESAIGQALSERLVELMGGKLTIRQTEGKGCCVIFSVLLPVQAPGTAPANDTAPDAAAQTNTAAATATPKRQANAPGAETAVQVSAPLGTSPASRLAQQVTVLLVDDNYSTRELIESMLDRQRFTVLPCSNGREALEALNLTAFDIVLMDLEMPELDGWSAMRILRRQEVERKLRRTPVIALGTAPFETERQKALEAGFDEHLCKPLRKSRLLEHMARLLAQPPKHSTVAPAETNPVRHEQSDALNLLSQDGMVDVRTSVDNLGGDAGVYLDAIEHLAPALSNWPTRFRDALARQETDRARQMALDMQGILEIVGAGPCAAALGRMADALAQQDKGSSSHAAALGDLDGHLLPLLAALQQAAEKIRAGRDLSSKEQGHNSAF